MEINISPQEGLLSLQFEDLDAAKSFLQDAAIQGAFMLQLESPLPQFQPFDVTFRAPRFSTQLEIEVAQVFPAGAGSSCVFSFKDWDDKAREALQAKLERSTKGPGSAKDEEAEDLSPAFRLQRMNASERLRLATKASRTERQILLRDSSPQVLFALLNHPRITDSEVRAIVASNFASATIMDRVVKNRRWMANPEILLALVRSPKTPPPMAIKYMQQLRTPDLQILAKGSSTREAIRRAALRVYLQRTGQSGRR